MFSVRMDVSMLSFIWLFVTLWTVACQAPLSMEFSSKNIGVGCNFPLQGIFQTQGLNPGLLHFLHYQEDSLPITQPEINLTKSP